NSATAPLLPDPAGTAPNRRARFIRNVTAARTSDQKSFSGRNNVRAPSESTRRMGIRADLNSGACPMNPFVPTGTLTAPLAPAASRARILLPFARDGLRSHHGLRLRRTLRLAREREGNPVVLVAIQPLGERAGGGLVLRPALRLLRGPAPFRRRGGGQQPQCR